MNSAMILAAGRGERMRPLTDHTPKPLLKVRGRALIDWKIEALARGGFTDLVVNTAWLGEQISAHLEQRLLSQIALQPNKYLPQQLLFLISPEGADFGHALETAGAIARALPNLSEVFWVVAGDVFTPDFEYAQAAVDRFMANGKLAHLWLVPNPTHNLQGDFGISADGIALNLPSASKQPRYTFR